MSQNKSDVLLKLKVDTSQVKREVRKATEIETKAKSETTRKSESKKNKTTWKGALKAGGAGLAIGAMIAKFSNNIMERRYEQNRQIMSSQSLSNSGLIASAEHSKNIMNANIDNLMKRASGVPVLEAKLKQNIFGSSEYRNFQQKTGLESEVQQSAISGVTGAYKSAMAQGYKLSPEEMKKMADVQMELSREEQKVSQMITKYVGTKESKEFSQSYIKLNQKITANSNIEEQISNLDAAIKYVTEAFKRLGDTFSGGAN